MDAETCIACAIAFVDGDRYLPDNSGGAIHFDCCGPERESYCNADGDPLGPDEAIPEPLIWTADPPASPVCETKSFMLLPAPKGTCPECAHAHAPDQPHNAQTMFYQVKFKLEQGRDPTWPDAMAHCAAEVQATWRAALIDMGVDVDGGKINPAKAR
jgi:hypothetical protein